jgi:hypothetical protein
MADDIITVQSVALTREKSVSIQRETKFYQDATNFVIKEILKKHISSAARTIELVRDDVIRRFLHLRDSTGPLSELNHQQLSEVFARRFSVTIVNKRFKERVEPARLRPEFAQKYEAQYVQDVVKTARVEIGQHRKMARTLRSIRDKSPYFKPGRMIFSGVIVSISDEGKALLLLTPDGEEVPIVFDKRSRNRVISKLQAMASGARRYGRIRIIWNREGYADIDIRV